jgi:hypothetical protein
MFELGVSEELSVALLNAVLLALWAVLPGLFLGCVRQSLVARRTQAVFSLHKSEAFELDRAAQLYDKVCRRIAEIEGQEDGRHGSWRLLVGRHADSGRSDADELEDLKVHASHLRAIIMRLRRSPLARLRSWVRVKSVQFALSRACATHIVGFTLLIVAFYVPERPAWGDEMTMRLGGDLVWYPLDEHLFYANAMASGLAALAAPLFYLMRSIALRREYWLEYCVLKEFAVADPGQVIDQPCGGRTAWGSSWQADSMENDQDGNCFEVLGLSQSATLEDVREAYKALVKQNHPDRVADMSPAIRKLADAETKRLNEAYQQAILSVPAGSRRREAAI